jgi:cyclophilin family peptidyl-prolyl cis-trans isomerase
MLVSISRPFASPKAKIRCALLLATLALAPRSFGAPELNAPIDVAAIAAEGEMITLEVTTAPFVINRRYKSMEGPSVSVPVRLKDLHSAGGKLQLGTPPLRTGHIAAQANLPACSAGTELWWFRGAKIEVLAPDSDQPSDPGFMCHFNLDVNQDDRKALLPSLPGFTRRLMIFTNGMKEFGLPRGYGLPVASEETWSCLFQALNHNLDGEHSFRHRITLYFNRHLGLNVPLKAVMWTTTFVAPPIDGDGEAASKICSCCGIPKMGLDARQDARSRFKMADGRTASGHWIIPPGRWSWSNPVNEFSSGFDKDRRLLAAWSHIHPYAERLTLRAFDKDCTNPRDVFTSNIRNVETGVGLAHIDCLSTEEGLPMPGSSKYEIEVHYNNRSGAKQDSMAVMGVYMSAPEWRLPEWSRVKQTGDLFCGIPAETKPGAIAAKPSVAAIQKPAGVPAAKAAAPRTVAKAPAKGVDGSRNALFHQLPRFTAPASAETPSYRVKVTTSDGSFVLRIEPAWAPKTAAALKPLFAHDLYANATMNRGVPGFILQVPQVLPNTLKPEDQKLLYRLPAEPEPTLKHAPGLLSMAMWADAPDSVTSSFSVMVGEAKHLDGKYTIFGRVEDWETAAKIVQAGIEAAQAGHPSKILRTEILAD